MCVPLQGLLEALSDTSTLAEVPNGDAETQGFEIPSLKLTAKAPENGWLEDDFPFGKPYFQGRTVSFRECIQR